MKISFIWIHKKIWEQYLPSVNLERKKQTNKEHVFVIDTYKKGKYFFLDKHKK